MDITESIGKKLITIGAYSKLTIADAKLLATNGVTVKLSHESENVLERSYRFLSTHIDQRIPIYGVNTQFGDQVSLLDPYLKDHQSSAYYNSIQARQENLIRSLSCGLGDIVASEVVKVAIMLRAHCLAQGYSGVSPNLCPAMLAFLNADLIPVVRKFGSIGASGDLIPMAMIAASMIGENADVIYRDTLMKAPQAMELAGLKKLEVRGRDGLAMINGTSFMTAIASLSVYNLNRLFTQMLMAIGMALESMQVISSAYHPLVHQLKNHQGENSINAFLLKFWQGSKLLSDLDELRRLNSEDNFASPRTSIHRAVQDYYSLRAVPQGFGPMLENIQTSIIRIEAEMNSVNDNPIIDPIDQKIHHAANFVGFNITDICDTLKNNIAQASTWLHALLANMVHPRKSHGLPINLIENPDSNNGFLSFQLLAAALAVQNRKIAQSHQSFTLPTEGDNQDVNSLGTHAAFDLDEAVTNLERLTAAIFLAATQALEFRGIENAGEKSQAIYKIIREYSPKLINSRPMTEDLMKIIDVLRNEII